MVDIIHEIVPSLIGKKDKGSSYLSESSEESDSVKTIVIRENEAIPHKQRRKVQPKKVKTVGGLKWTSPAQKIYPNSSILTAQVVMSNTRLFRDQEITCLLFFD